MAWIMKNSAGTVIEKRDQPYLDDELKAELDGQTWKYPTKKAMTLPVLHAIQHKHGFVPHQAIEEAAAYTEQTPAEVLDTATFYEEFWLQPKGRYLIMVCQSLSCELMGHDGLLARIKDKLGIVPGETTDDGKYTLMTAECLGSCGTAPCALVNETLHETLTADNLEQILTSLS